MFTLIHEDLRQAEFSKSLNLPLKDIQGREGEIAGKIKEAWTEFVDGGNKFSAIKCLDTQGDDTLQTLIKMNSERAALVDVISAQTEMTNLAGRIQSKNENDAEADGREPEELDIQSEIAAYFRAMNGPTERLGDRFMKTFEDSPLNKLTDMQIGSGLEVKFDSGLEVYNTLLKTGAGTANAGASGTAAWPTDFRDMPGFVPFPTREIQVIDLFPVGMTDKGAIKYLEETTYLPGAASREEAAALAEANFQLTRKDEPIQSIGTHIPIAMEQLEDEPQIQGYLNQRLNFGVRQEVDGQLLLGDGAAPKLEGILERGSIQTRAKASGENAMDTLRAAQDDVRVGGRAMPGPYVLHPYDWRRIQLLQSTAGGYYMGDPRMDFGNRLWSYPVALTDHLTEGTGLTGDFMQFSEMTVRHDVRVEFGQSGDDFKNLIVRIRAYVRLGLCVFRHKAFVKLTGLNS